MPSSRWIGPVKTVVAALAVALVVPAYVAHAEPSVQASTRIILVRPDGWRKPGDDRVRDPGKSAGSTVNSLREALDLVRAVRRAAAAGPVDIRIELAPGEHVLERPVLLDASHSGSLGHPLVIQGSADSTSKLVGSRRLVPVPRGRVPVRSALNRADVPAVARPHLRRYALPATLAPGDSIDARRPQDRAPSVPFEVFDAQGPLRPARWPNSGWSKIAATGGNLGGATFTLAGDRLRRWQSEPDLWAGGYWRHDWRYETHRIIAIGPAASTVTLAELPFDGIKAGQRLFVYHALAELDEPGEWYRDRATNELLVWPRTAAGSEDALDISLVESAFQLTGVQHVRLRHLVIEKTRGDAIVVKGGADVVIEDCTIRWTGGRAATFEDTAGGGIARSSIRETGAGGVLLYGGDRLNLVPGGLAAVDNRFERFARLSTTYAPAVELGGVGNAAVGNFITDADHEGIEFRGNDHVIERNEISAVMRDSADGGAIYTGRDWTARGTRIRHNFIHDVQPAAGMEVKGVYLDDMASGTIIDGNVFLRVQQAVFIGGGFDNQVTGNIFVAAEPAVHIDSRGIDAYREHIDDPGSELRTRFAAMPVRSEVWSARYPTLPGLLQGQPQLAARNVVTGNLLAAVAPLDLQAGTEHRLQTLGPNMTMADVGPAVAFRAGRADSASELGEILRLQLKGSPLLSLPFGSLDRQSWLQRSLPRR